MQYRKLGSSDLVVSEISLGSWLTYGGGVSARAGRGLRPRAPSTSASTSSTPRTSTRAAQAEELLGEVLRGRAARRLRPRDQALLPDVRDGTAASPPRRSRSSSTPRCARLRVDHVDLYQCHRYDPETPLEETMAALTEAVRQGKTRYIGFSEWSPGSDPRRPRAPGGERFVSSQPQYSLLWRAPGGRGLPALRAGGHRPDRLVAARAGDPHRQVPPRRRAAPRTRARRARRWACSSSGGSTTASLEGVQRLRPIAAELGLTLSQLALAWVLRRPEVSSAIIGASRPEQVKENAAASGVKLSADVLRRIDEAFVR